MGPNSFSCFYISKQKALFSISIEIHLENSSQYGIVLISTCILHHDKFFSKKFFHGVSIPCSDAERVLNFFIFVHQLDDRILTTKIFNFQIRKSFRLLSFNKLSNLGVFSDFSSTDFKNCGSVFFCFSVLCFWLAALHAICL